MTSTLHSTKPRVIRASFASVLIAALCIGCGTTREQNATLQLVVSDAVDRSVQYLDFRPLSGQKVYLDNSYLRHIKGEGFVNSEYVTSALRQQIVAAGCLLQDTPQDADIIIEARVGALGTDDHRVTFGLPESSALSSAVSLIPGAPQIPIIPEIAFARRDAREAASKVAAFAYHRETREAIWQSGVKHSQATARDTWVLGVGPFQGGTIREQTKLAGSQLKIGRRSDTGSQNAYFDRPPVDYTAQIRFNEGWPVTNHGGLSPDMLGPANNADLATSVQIAEAEVQIAEALKAEESTAEAQLVPVPVEIAEQVEAIPDQETLKR